MSLLSLRYETVELNVPLLSEAERQLVAFLRKGRGFTLMISEHGGRWCVIHLDHDTGERLNGMADNLSSAWNDLPASRLWPFSEP